ncbi:MAG: hypothetical protein AAF571_01355 [Verrucomicrobiota bacterium]
MTLEFNELFVVYVSVFLAVILAAWLISLWRGYTFKQQGRVSIQCPFCETVFDAGENRKYLRCPDCHGRFRKQVATAELLSPAEEKK